MSRAPIIALCGASQASEAELATAYECGALLAGRGVTVVSGGLGGVMAAGAAGVKSGGGVCIALLPGASADEAGPEVTIALATGMGEMRNALLARVAQGVIAIGGGWGTLSEIAFARRIGRPVALLRSWELRAPAGDAITDSLHRAASAHDAVDWMLAQLTPEKR